MTGRLFTFLFFFLLPYFCCAQSFRFTQYTTHNGLPIDNVYAAAQDSYGFIWFATDFGISKFDGYRFVNFYKKSGMANKAVTDIVYAGGDSLIFLSYPNAIQSIHADGSIKTIGTCVDFSFQQLVRHKERYYFYQREQAKVGVLEHGKIKVLVLDSMFGNKAMVIHSVFSVNDTAVAFCTNKGMYIAGNGTTKQLLPGEDVAFGVVNNDNTITAVSNNTVVLLNKEYSVSVTSIKIPAGVSVYHMTTDAEGDIWLRGIDRGIYRLHQNQLQEMSAALSMQHKIINEFFCDRNGNTWFCTDGSGVLLKRANIFRVYETSEGLVNNRVQQLLLHNEALFIGTSNGLSVKKNDVITNIELPAAGKGLKWVFNLRNLAGNKIGIAAARVFKFNKPASPFIEDVQLNGYSFTAFKGFAGMQLNDSVYWVASTDNLFNIVKGRVKVNFSLPDAGVRKVFDIIYYQNKLWVGSNNGIVLLQNERLVRLDTINGNKLGQVFRFLTDKKGVLWVATENGLFYNDGAWMKVMPGSTYGSNYCTAVTEDNEGRIWCATWDGFFITDGLSRINFNTTDGLPSKTCNAILYDPALQSVYIGTDNGLALVECSRLKQPQLFQKVFITCSYADSLTVANGTMLESYKNNLHFYFNLPFYGTNNEIEYEYRLDKGKWQSTFTPDIFLTDISSKNHNLEVRAKINGAVVTGDDAVFIFSIKEQFYKKWWFWLLLLLLLQYAVLRLVNRYNKRKREKQLLIQQQQMELASLKQQAFTSLMNPHFIFNALNSIQYYINKQDRQTANKYLSDFATLVRRSFDAAQKPFVTLDEELETIRLYLQLEKMRFTDKFDYSITLNNEAEDEEWLLPGMVLQPFLENAILHGLAPLSSHGQINIDISGADNTLFITITDNGIGIQKSKQLQTAKKHTSRGMQLIKERLDILSTHKSNPVKLTITDFTPGADNPGTKIELVIPQQVYQARG